MNLSIFTVFLKNINFISKIRRSKVTDDAALKTSCLNQKAKSLEHRYIWYVALVSRTLPKLLKLYPWGQKKPCPGDQIFYIGLYRENVEKFHV